MGNVVPDAGVHTAATEGATRSWAVTVKVTEAPAGAVASVVIDGGTAIVGGVVSTTVTVKLAVPVFPNMSLAWQRTVVVPRGKVVPETGVQATGPGLSGSWAVTTKATVAPPGPVASTRIGGGTVSTGGLS